MTVDYFEVSVTVEIAFGCGAFDTPVWTDVSEYVREFTTDRGRQDEFGSYSPGTARVVLSNADRRFDPSHAAGDYYGDLVPMVPLRISAIYAPAILDEDGGVLLDEEGDIIGVGPGDSIEYPLFYGFVQGWPQQYVDNIDSTVAVDCVDAFRLLEQATLTGSAIEAAIRLSSPAHYWPLQQSSASYVDVIGGCNFVSRYPSGDTQIDRTYPTAAPQSLTPGQNPSTVVAAQNGLRYDDPIPTAGKALEAWVYLGTNTTEFYIAFSWTGANDDRIGITNLNSLSGGGLPRRWSIGYSNSVDNRYIAAPDSNQNCVAGLTHVALSVDATDARLYVNGDLVETKALSVGTSVSSVADGGEVWLSTLGAVGGFSHIAYYSTAPDASAWAAHYNAGRFAFGGDFVEFPCARVDRVLDEIGWPSGTRDIADGGIELGEYLPSQRSALDYIREIETTEQGLFFVGPDGDIVFRDRGWQFDQTSVADFGDSGSDLSFVDVVPDGNTVDVVRNQVKVIYNGSDSNVVVEDATSIAAYGYGSDSLSTPAIQTIVPARGLASFKVRVGKDPRTRVSSLSVMPRSDPTNLFPAVLGADLGEVVTVSFTPLGVGSASTFTTSIQGVRHSVGRGRWDVEFYLAPAVSESGPYWKIGDATLGRIGAAYGNLLSY